MNIALVHYRVGETDGVSLEMDKWKLVYEAQGHNCFYIAGSQGQTKAEIVDEIEYICEFNNRHVDNAYKALKDYNSEDDFKADVESYANIIQKKVEAIIEAKKIDVMIVNNIWSLGWNLSAMLAFTRIAKKYTNIQFLGHNHDFWWEREFYLSHTCNFVSEILEDCTLPNFDNVKHCVINSLAQLSAKKKRNVDTVVVPNVFDFEAPLWIEDSFNNSIRSECNIQDNDIVVLQATRVVERKGIELMFDTLAYMQTSVKNNVGKTLYNGQTIDNDSKVVFVFAGLIEDDVYFAKLVQKMQEMNIEYRIISDRVGHSRDEANNIYSLWDCYVCADVVSYPSIFEGWGNQFLEAMFAKKPTVVFEYTVFTADIKSCNFDVISLGDTYEKQGNLNNVNDAISKEVSQKCFNILLDKKQYTETTQRNFDICAKYFSIKALEDIITPLIS